MIPFEVARMLQIRYWQGLKDVGWNMFSYRLAYTLRYCS